MINPLQSPLITIIWSIFGPQVFHQSEDPKIWLLEIKVRSAGSEEIRITPWMLREIWGYLLDSLWEASEKW